LSGFHIVLAPLRDRGRDVVFLAERLLARLAAGMTGEGFRLACRRVRVF
jgi:transcriptional regulator with GAF, ATPase, and Fis domain